MAQTCHHLNIQVYRLASVFLSAWMSFGMFESDCLEMGCLDVKIDSVLKCISYDAS